MRQSNAPSNQSLDRALRLLDRLASTGSEMTIGDICEYINVSKSTAYSMIQSFLAAGYLERNTENGKYSVGYKFYENGMAYRYKFPFIHVASKHAQSYSQKYAVRVTVAVLCGLDKAIQILTFDSSPIPDMAWGYALPSYSAAVGKVLLAYRNEEQVYDWLEGAQLTKYTPTTTTNVDTIMNQLRKARKDGYYVAFGEYNPARVCIAAPVFDMAGRCIAAFSFQVSPADMDSRGTELVTAVKLAARSISSDLGYKDFGGI